MSAIIADKEKDAVVGNKRKVTSTYMTTVCQSQQAQRELDMVVLLCILELTGCT